MKPTVLILCCFLSGFTGGICSLVSGKNVGTCEIRGLPKPEFKVASECEGETVGLRIAIKPKHQRNENLVLLANYFNQKCCKADELNVLVFDNTKDAREFSAYKVPRLPDTARAIYYVNRKNGKEKLVRVKVVNNAQVETIIALK